MIPLLIYVCVPAVAIVGYTATRKRMLRARIESPPERGLFLVFACYGALLLGLLTALFWEWSGLASLGTIVMLGGCVVLLVQAAYLSPRRKLSIFHDRIWLASIGFIPAILLAAMIVALGRKL